MFRLLLWPSLITLAISLVRFTSEVQGWVTTASGGRGLPLGISWLMLVFGAWFGRRLAGSGSLPSMPRAWVWPLVAMLAIVGTGVVMVRPLVGAEPSEVTFATLRTAVLSLGAVSAVGAVAMFFVWPRLAFTLLLYALPARATVVAITWFAKHQDWNTHYTKFGPMGMERDAGLTLLSACIAQFGFWVPLTIVGGMLAGCLFARPRK